MFRVSRFLLITTAFTMMAASCSDDEPLTIIVEPSLEITFVEDAPVGDAVSAFELISRAYVKNITDQPISVKVRRSIEQPTILTDNNSICWEYCYVESIDESPDAITLLPGEINQDFTGHVYPDGDGRAAEGEITYVFFNEEETRDKVVFTTNYRVQ